MMGIAQLFNNTLRQYPVYWWTPDETGSMLYRKGREECESTKGDEVSDAERGEKPASADVSRVNAKDGSDSERTLHLNALAGLEGSGIEILPGLEAIHIAPHMVRVPPELDLTNEESIVLQRLMTKLRRHLNMN